MLQWTWVCKYFYESLIFILLDIYPEVGLLDHTVVLFLIIWVISIVFSIVLYHFTFPPTVHRVSVFPSSPTLVIFWFFVLFWFLVAAILMGIRWYVSWLWFVFPWWIVMLTIFSHGRWPLCIFLEKRQFKSFAHLKKSGYLGVFLLWSCRYSLYILDINVLSDTWFANIFSHSVDCLFTLLNVSFVM